MVSRTEQNGETARKNVIRNPTPALSASFRAAHPQAAKLAAGGWRTGQSGRNDVGVIRAEDGLVVCDEPQEGPNQCAEFLGNCAVPGRKLDVFCSRVRQNVLNECQQTILWNIRHKCLVICLLVYCCWGSWVTGHDCKMPNLTVNAFSVVTDSETADFSRVRPSPKPGFFC